MIFSARIYSIIVLFAVSGCTPALPRDTGSLSAPATYMQDFDPGEAPVSDCTAPFCAAPGLYGMNLVSIAPMKMQGGNHPSFMMVMHHMHQNMPKPSGDVDIDFLAGMIPHHQAAIDMAQIELMHGQDPFARTLAQSIIASQAVEIRLMQQFLAQQQPGPVDQAAKEFPAIMHRMHAAMPVETGNIDSDFIIGMIPHHQAAVDMAAVILQHGRNANIRRLALDITGAQQAEISQMNSWLYTH